MPGVTMRNFFSHRLCTIFTSWGDSMAPSLASFAYCNTSAAASPATLVRTVTQEQRTIPNGPCRRPQHLRAAAHVNAHHEDARCCGAFDGFGHRVGKVVELQVKKGVLAGFVDELDDFR